MKYLQLNNVEVNQPEVTNNDSACNIALKFLVEDGQSLISFEDNYVVAVIRNEGPDTLEDLQFNIYYHGESSEEVLPANLVANQVQSFQRYSAEKPRYITLAPVECPDAKITQYFL